MAYLRNVGLRYTDDTALSAEAESAIQSIVDVVKQAGEETGLSMNAKKTKTMVVCRDETPNVRTVANLEQVKKFKYLGQWITDDGRCKCEIKNRTEIVRSTFIKIRDLRCVNIAEIAFRDQKTSGKMLCTFHLFVCLRIMDTK